MTTLLTRWKNLRAPSAQAATVDPSGAAEAACAARVALAEEVIRAEDTSRVTDSLRDLRSRNHFADLWIDAARPRRA